MRRRRTNLAFLLGLSACQTAIENNTRAEPSFIQVSLGSSQVTGSLEAPLDFSSEEQMVGLAIETLDRMGDPIDFEGSLQLNVRPGSLTGSPYVSVSGGQWSGEVGIKNGFGPTRVWFTENAPLGSENDASYATGVSDPLFFAIPTIGEMNRIDDHESNQLAKEFAEIRAVDRDIRIVTVGTNGFWATDMLDAAGEHNSLFVYTFSKPEDDVQVGRRLSLLTGNNQEYLATTQISFPTLEVTDEPALEMPAASELPENLCGATDTLEGYESALVSLKNVQIPDGFGTDLSDEDYEDYINYGQWPVVHTTGGCTWYISSAVPCPNFSPTDGLALAEVTGMLSEVWDKWILTIRSPDDLPAGVCGGTQGPQPIGPARPLPREAPTSWNRK
jgi:hypothetical protein